MALTEHEVLEGLKEQGITTLRELAKKVADDSAIQAQEVDTYLLTGKNYSLYHPE